MNNKYSLYTFFCIVFIGIIYFFSVAQDPALGDSLVFNIQAYNGFVFESNATNHILYSNFLALLHKVFPFINVHFLCVGVSIAAGIFSLRCLQKLLRIFDISPKSTMMCVLIFGLSFTFWRVSVITEVYTFYLSFVFLFLINLFRFLKDKKIKYFYCLSIFLGILFLIHIQTILFIPLYAYLIIKNFRVLKQHAIYGGLITAVLFSILLIPVALGYNSFVNLFTVSGQEKSVMDIDFNVITKSIVRNSGFLFYNFLFFIIFIFWGIKNKINLDYMLIGLLPFLAFCIKHDVSDSYVFHLVPYIFLLILMGRGLDRFPKIYVLLPLVLPLFYFASYKIIEKTSFGKKIDKEKGFKGGTKYLFFPALNTSPDLNYFLKKYKEDSLYQQEDLKGMYPFVIEWEKIKKEN